MAAVFPAGHHGGASTTALYATVYHYIRKDEGTLWRTFWGAFRESLKRSTVVWLAVLAVVALLMLVHPLSAVTVFVPAAAGILLGVMAPGLLTILPAGLCLCVSMVIEHIFALHLQPKEEKLEGEME